MLSFQDPTIRGAAALSHLVANGRASFASVRQELDACPLRSAEEQRFLLSAVAHDILVNNYWHPQSREEGKELIQLLRNEVGKAFATGQYVGLLANILDGCPAQVTAESIQGLISSFTSKEKLGFLVSLCYAVNGQHASIGRKLLHQRLQEYQRNFTELVTLVGSEELTLQLAVLASADPAMSSFAEYARSNNLVPVMPATAADEPETIYELSNSISSTLSLAGIMLELGPACISTVEEANRLLDLFGPACGTALTPAAIGECIAVMMGNEKTSAREAWLGLKIANEHSNGRHKEAAAVKEAGIATGAGANGWQPQFFVEAVKERVPNLDWQAALMALDNKYLGSLEQKEKFAVVLGVYKKATGSNAPLKCFTSQLWTRNPQAQLQALRFLMAHSDLVDRGSDRLPDTLLNDLKPQGAEFGVLWRHPEFVATLIDLVAFKGPADITPMFQAAGRACPGGVTAGLLCCTPQRSAFALKQLVLLFAEKGAMPCLPESVVAHVLQHGHVTLLNAALSRFVSGDPAQRIAAVLPILQQHHLFQQFLNVTTDPHVFALASISGQELNMLPRTLIADALQHKNGQGLGCLPSQLAIATVEVCDELCTGKGAVAVTAAVRNALTSVIDADHLCHLLPKTVAYAASLIGQGATDRDSGTPPPPSFTPQQEKQASDIIEAMLKQHHEPNSTLTMCRTLAQQGAQDESKLQLLHAIGRAAADEAQKISQYPQRDINALATFIGYMIEQGMMHPYAVHNALRFLYSCISKPSDARVRDYATTALTVIKNKIPQWPQFARQLRQVPDIDMHVPGIVAVIDRAERESAAAAAAAHSAQPEGSPFSPPSGPQSNLSIGTGLHTMDIRTLLGNNEGPQYPVPSSVVQDRINFIVGNTDPTNLEHNTAELKQLLQSRHYPYFADYLVVKRIALEPNNHKMYLQMISIMDSQLLDQALRHATIVACRRLLESEKIRTVSGERTLLKNLGSFLGQITLARNVPILARDLDLRELIPKGLIDGKLIAIVPFLAKILEQTVNSRAFRVPSPWIMGLLAQLCEMYHLPDLKITLRFEVEVLCRNIGMLINDVVEAVKDRAFSPHRRPLAELKMQHVDLHDSPDFRMAVEEPVSSRLAADAPPYEPRRGGPNTPATPQFGPGFQTGSPAPQPATSQFPEAHPSEEIRFIAPAHHPAYRALLQRALEAAFQELMGGVERSVTISCTTTREIVVKDFQRDPDEQRIRRAALTMARGLAANLVTVIVRDMLPQTVRKQLQQVLAQVIPQETLAQDPAILERLVGENLEPCVAALDTLTSETTAKCIEEMLLPVFEERRKALRANDFPVIPPDQQRPSIQAIIQSLPEHLRPRNGPQQAHLMVYQEFANLIPRPNDSVDQVIHLMQVIEEAAHRHYQQVPPASRQQILSLTNVAFTETTQSEHHNLIKQKLIEVSHLITEANAVPLLHRMFPRIIQLAEKVQCDTCPVGNLEHSVNLLINEVCLFVLQAVREKGQGRAVSELTRLYLSHERRWYNRELATNLVRLRVVDISEFDRLLTQALETDKGNRTAVEFAGHIVQKCLIDDKLATVKDLKNTLDILEHIAVQAKKNRQHPTAVRVPTQHGTEHRDQVEALFKEWLSICDRNNKASDDRQQVALQYVQKLQQNGMLKVEMMLDKFFGLLIELSVEDFATQAMLLEREGVRGNHGPQPPGDAHRNQCSPPPSRFPQETKLFTAIDAFSDLVIVLVKCCTWSRRPDDADAGRQTHAEVALVVKVLSVVAKALQHNHDYFAQPSPPPLETPLPEGCVLQDTHMQQPFFRFFSNLLIALAPTQIAEEAVGGSADVFPVMASTFHAINPQRLPGFAFAWVELVCHRVFIAKTLKHTAGWPSYFKLLNDALRFIDPFARASDMTPALCLFFKCLLKVMLLLLHDFPEFLLAYHQPLCDAIPMCCVQLRNVVLSAFPRNTKLPDPFSATMRIEQLPEVQHAPTLVATVREVFTSNLGGQPCPLDKAEFESYIETKKPAQYPVTVAEKLRTNGRYNIPLLNGLVLYSCISAYESQVKRCGENQLPPVQFDASSGAVELISELLQNFDSEGRYYLINACANQLRFPNRHTHFFSALLLHLFLQPSSIQLMIQEVITRVLAERLIITRPHPWGLLITFIEIVKNPKYELWSKPFIRCTVEIERMFDNVNQSVSSSGNQPAAAAAPPPQNA